MRLLKAFLPIPLQLVECKQFLCPLIWVGGGLCIIQEPLQQSHSAIPGRLPIRWSYSAVHKAFLLFQMLHTNPGSLPTTPSLWRVWIPKYKYRERSIHCL